MGCDGHVRSRGCFINVVSIHAPLWGATRLSRKCQSKLSVSIHAPLWGATSTIVLKCQEVLGFNPRTPVGCDLDTLFSISPFGRMFQSTHPCGVRRFRKSLKPLACLFQSTHPCGVRLKECWKQKSFPRFQSTHPCGVRLILGATQRKWDDVSIHAPLWGATRIRAVQTGFD